MGVEILINAVPEAAERASERWQIKVVCARDCGSSTVVTRSEKTSYDSWAIRTSVRQRFAEAVGAPENVERRAP